MKTIGQTYPLSEFEPGDVGAFVFLDGTDGEPFILDYHRGSGSYIQYAHNVSSLPGSETTPARYLGRGRIEPARIVMEGDPEIQANIEALQVALAKSLRGALARCRCNRQEQYECLDCDADLALLDSLPAAAIAATAPKPTEEVK